MARKPYDSDLTDEQWRELEPLIPPAKPGGRPRGQDMRAVIDGIRYVLRSGLRSGCGWRLMPHDLPNAKTCWYYFDRFSGDGTWRTIAETLHPAARLRSGRDAQPSEASVDAQSVKTTKKGDPRGRSVTTRANA